MKHNILLLMLFASSLHGLTVKTVTVKATGGSYTSLAAAVAGEYAANPNLVTADIQLNIELFYLGAADVGPVAFLSTWVTDSTHYVNVYVAPGNGHSGVWGSSAYNLTSLAAGLDIETAYVRVTGVQINSSGATVLMTNVNPAASHIVLDQLILRCSTGSGCGYGVAFESGNSVLRNSVILGAAASGGTGVELTYANYPATVTLENCTVSGFTTGVANAYGTLTVKNTYSGGNSSTDYSAPTGGGTTSYTTSASSDATSRTGVTPSVAYSTSAGGYFTNVTAGSENLNIGASSALKAAGTSLAGEFTTDITGATRSGTWDIGAFMYQVAATATRKRVSVIQ